MPCQDLLYQAYQHILQNDFMSAIATFKKAISLCPQQADLYYRLSITYARSHLLEEAERAVEWAAQLDPDNSDYRAQLRHVQAMRIHREALEFSKDPSSLQLAKQMLTRSIELDPVCIQAYVDLGNVLRDLGEYENAMTAYQMALDLVPGHFEAKLRMLELKPLIDEN